MQTLHTLSERERVAPRELADAGTRARRRAQARGSLARALIRAAIDLIGAAIDLIRAAIDLIRAAIDLVIHAAPFLSF
jgi:hypothetical protein